jgi:hypothetical protein
MMQDIVARRRTVQKSEKEIKNQIAGLRKEMEGIKQRRDEGLVQNSLCSLRK